MTKPRFDSTLHGARTAAPVLEGRDLGIDRAQHRAGEALLDEGADAEAPIRAGRSQIAFLGRIEFLGLAVVHDGADKPASARAQGTVGLGGFRHPL